MYGVLGLSKIEDEEGSSAYLYGKDIEQNRHAMLVKVFPTLYQDHDVNRRLFYQGMEEKKKEIEENNRSLDKIRAGSHSTFAGKGNGQEISGEQIKQNMVELLAKQNKVQIKINSVMNKVQRQHSKLVDLNGIINLNLFKDDDEVIENQHMKGAGKVGKVQESSEAEGKIQGIANSAFEKNAALLNQLRKDTQPYMPH